MLVFFALACAAPCLDGYGRDDDGNCVPLATETGDDTSDTDDTGDAGAEPVALDGGCEAPDALPDDPIALLGTFRAEASGLFFEGTDVAVDPAAGRAYVVGVGGLLALDLSADEPTLLARATAFWENRFERIALGEGGAYAAVTHRDYGIEIVDLSSDELSPNGRFEEPGVSGVAWVEDRIYATFYEGAVRVWDAGDLQRTEPLHALDGLGSPRAIAIAGDRAYAADFERGVAVIDLSGAPELVGFVETVGAPQDIAAADGALYVAAGTAGIEIFSLDDPDAPAPLARVDYHQSIVDVAAADGLVWGVGHEDVVALDVSDPGAPVSLGAQQTAQWALAVDAAGDRAYVADWFHVEVHGLTRGALAPEADPNRSVVYLPAGATDLELEIANVGAVDLSILGGSVDDPRFAATADRDRVAPGQAAVVSLAFDDDGQPVDASLCLATDDPDEPVMQIGLSTSSTTNSSFLVGEVAPDFALTDLDGNYRQLSDHLGQPVFIAFFATW